MRIPHPIRSLPLARAYLYFLLHFPKNFSAQSNFRLRLAPQSHHRSTMAGESENYETSVQEDAKYGFERDEMHKSSLAGTVDPYDRHVFLTYSNHQSWPSRVEDSDADPFPKHFAAALKERKNDIKLKTRFTICEGSVENKLLDGDVLIFPEMMVYRGLTDSEVDNFVEDVLVNGKPWQSGMSEKWTGSFVFVCAHNNRDKRCGICGPVLIEKFKEEFVSKDLKDSAFVTACSHVGGHKYAGNVIIFGAGPDGKVIGNWYGYVTPDDVPDLVDKQIVHGETIDRILRGQMGESTREAEKVANGSNEKQPQEIEVAAEEIAAGSCCQGAKGFQCCQDEKVEKGGFSCGTAKWEQRHILTTVALAGAIAAVAVAYGFYRRAR